MPRVQVGLVRRGLDIAAGDATRFHGLDFWIPVQDNLVLLKIGGRLFFRRVWLFQRRDRTQAPERIAKLGADTVYCALKADYLELLGSQVLDDGQHELDAVIVDR